MRSLSANFGSLHDFKHADAVWGQLVESQGCAAPTTSATPAALHPEIYGYLVTVLASRLRETDEALAATSFLTVKARLARALLELAELLGEDHGSGRILITMRRQILAPFAEWQW